MDRLLFTFLAVFFVLYGLLNVTNVQVAFGPVLIGLAALAAGVVCAVRAFR